MPTTQTFICREKPTRVNDRTFTIANTPLANTEQVFLNGILQNAGSDNDYTISGKTITFHANTLLNAANPDDDVVLVNYILEIYTPTQPDSTVSSFSLDSRADLIKWCLRKLGAPVIDINIDEDQIEDRIDEALRYFRDYHFDGVERVYLKHQITASSMELETPYTGDIVRGVVLTGLTSGAQATAFDKSVDNKTIRFSLINGIKFSKGETVAIADTTDTVEILNSDTSLFWGDIDNQYIPLGTKVLAVTNIIPQERATIGGNLGGMFDFQYQFALNNMFNLASTDIVTYDIYQRYMSQWEFMFRGAKGIRFNRKTDRVELDIQDYVVDRWIVFECWSALDPALFTEIYSDEFVREYACALIKMQWGSNMKKFSGISLPGGVTLNGQQIYDEAKQELDVLRERVRKEFELPPDFIVG